MKFYFELASKYSYVVVIVFPKTSWCLNYKEVAKRNKHGVNEHLLKQKVDMFLSENMNPGSWDWLLNEKWTSKILNTVSEYFDVCAKKHSELARYLKKNVIDKTSNFSSFYSHENLILNCTACYIGNKPTFSAHTFD